jgi:hypothetical protein
MKVKYSKVISFPLESGNERNKPNIFFFFFFLDLILFYLGVRFTHRNFPSLPENADGAKKYLGRNGR